MHLGPRMIEGRNAKEHVSAFLAVVFLLCLGRMHEPAVLVKYSLGESCRSRGKIDGGVIVIGQNDIRRHAWVICHFNDEILCEGWRRSPYVEQKSALGQCVDDLLDATDELRSEDEDAHVGLIHAVLDLVGCISEIKRNSNCSSLQYAEINRKPVKAVHQKNAHLFTLCYTSGNEAVGNSVGLLIENSPGNFLAVRALLVGFHKVVFFPCCKFGNTDSRIQRYQGHFIRPFSGISLKILSNRHVCSFPGINTQATQGLIISNKYLLALVRKTKTLPLILTWRTNYFNEFFNSSQSFDKRGFQS